MAQERSRTSLEEEASHGRGFRWIAALAGLAALAVAGLAAAGLVFPEFVSATSLTVGLAGTSLVLGLGLIAALVYLDRALAALGDHHAALVDQREGLESAREEAWERHEELANQRFGERIDELRSRLEELDAEHASLAQQTRRTSTPTPFGDIHDIEAVAGIEATEADELLAMGVGDTEQLWMANAKRVAENLDRDPLTVRRWQHEAELMALPSVGPRSAEILVRSGVRTIADLTAWDPDRLAQRLQDRRVAFDTEPEEDLVNRERVAGWIENARVHDPTAYRVHRQRGGRSTSSTPA
jgi:predicted flap endonuclease-1-like 5' DNA nuclease